MYNKKDRVTGKSRQKKKFLIFFEKFGWNYQLFSQNIRRPPRRPPRRVSGRFPPRHHCWATRYLREFSFNVFGGTCMDDVTIVFFAFFLASFLAWLLLPTFLLDFLLDCPIWETGSIIILYEYDSYQGLSDSKCGYRLRNNLNVALYAKWFV